MSTWLECPVLIAGQMKSGTSLFRMLLDGNPEFFLLPPRPSFQTLFMRSYQSARHMAMDWLVGGVSESVTKKAHFPALPLVGIDHTDLGVPVDIDYLDVDMRRIALKGSFGRNYGEDVLEEVFSFDEYHKKLISALERLESADVRQVLQLTAGAFFDTAATQQSMPPPKRWGYALDAEVQTDIFSGVMHKDHEIEQCLNLFPSAKLVLLVRDPHATVLSRYHHYYGESRISRVQRSSKALARWYHILSDSTIVHESLLLAHRLHKRYGPDRMMIVRYEDLLLRTENRMRCICDFLEISFDPIMLHPTVLGKPTGVSSARSVVRADKVDGTKAWKWKEEIPPLLALIVDSFITKSQGIYQRFNYRTVHPFFQTLLISIVGIRPLFWLLRHGGGPVVALGRQILHELSGYRVKKNIVTAGYPSRTWTNGEAKRVLAYPNDHILHKQVLSYLTQRGIGSSRKSLVIGAGYGILPLAVAEKSAAVIVLEEHETKAATLREVASKKTLTPLHVLTGSELDLAHRASFDLIISLEPPSEMTFDALVMYASKMGAAQTQILLVAESYWWLVREIVAEGLRGKPATALHKAISLGAVCLRDTIAPGNRSRRFTTDRFIRKRAAKYGFDVQDVLPLNYPMYSNGIETAFGHPCGFEVRLSRTRSPETT